MEEPQGQNRFFDRCAEYLLELSDELERNLYIEAIVKEYHKYGITTENLRKRVNSLALRGTPAERRTVPKSSEPAGKKKENAADKAQKLMLTWLVTYPGIFETVEKYLYTNDLPNPDLLIRTSGEKRISNYLLWQIAYSEIYITDTYWPEFDKGALALAIIEFAKRQRRWGK